MARLELDWMRHALCATLPKSTQAKFFSASRDGSKEKVAGKKKQSAKKDREQAALVCSMCPVETQCLQYAEKIQPTAGVWGGKDFTEENM